MIGSGRREGGRPKREGDGEGERSKREGGIDGRGRGGSR